MDRDYKILVVDDEEANLQKMQRTFLNRYPVLTATSGKEALEYVATENGIAVIVTDQRMPDMTGVELLRSTLDVLPNAIRVILTGFTDVDVLMEAINHCKVYRYIVKPWDPSDLLMTVERGLEAYQLAAENERFRRELIRRERLARELEIAREIQRYILPPQYPPLDDYELAAEYQPALEVGGDLYDFDWDAARRSMQIVVGDVSGKSIPAALYGAVFSGQVRSLFANPLRPAQTLSLLNAGLISRYQVNNFIAVIYLQLDLQEGTGCLANGGMPYPYLLKDGKTTKLSVSGVPLGLLENLQYEEISFRLDPGDMLVITSDGATEAMNPREEMYEERRFLESVQRHRDEPIAEFVKSLYQDIASFTQNADVHDDITILALRRRA